MPSADPDWIEKAPLSDLVRELARRGVVRRYPKGSVLIHEGDDGETLYVILAGRLRIFCSSQRNDREITYGKYGPGEYVGEMSLDGGKRSASVEACEPTVCSMVTKVTLQQFIHEHPEFAFELLAKVIRRARAATLRASGIGLNDVYGRLKEQLDTSTEVDDRGRRRMTEKLTHKDLASLLACSREMVTRLLADLREGGYIEIEDGVIVVLKPLPPRW